MLSTVVGSVPEPRLRSRVHDVLALSSTRNERWQHAQGSVASLLVTELTPGSWHTVSGEWQRAFHLARSFGQREHLTAMKAHLLGAFRTSVEGYEPHSLAAFLGAFPLSSEENTEIAERLWDIALASGTTPLARSYAEGAAACRLRNGNQHGAAEAIAWVVANLVAEGDQLAQSTATLARAAVIYNEALATCRRLSLRLRRASGIEDLPQQIARRISEVGPATIGTLQATEITLPVSGEVRAAAISWVTQPELDSALVALSLLAPFSDYARELDAAYAQLNANPLLSLVSVQTLAGDGRTIHRSEGRGEQLYGVESDLWILLSISFEGRITDLTMTRILPASNQITNDHAVRLSDIARLVATSNFYHASRTLQVSRALLYGFRRDYSSAAQLLSPQIEFAVRRHFIDAGEPTTTVDESGIEQHVGLSALMKRARADDILGPDLAFEIRALFCGPLGPNLRNAFAHGLVNDEEADELASVYTWWFGMKLALMRFWNAHHDVDAAAAMEPVAPAEPRCD